MTDDGEPGDADDGDAGPSADDEDPFEQFEADVGDREGDPFERLPDEAESGPGEPRDTRRETTTAGAAGPDDDAADGTEPESPDAEESEVEETEAGESEAGETESGEPGGDSSGDTPSVGDGSASSGPDDVTESGMAFDVGRAAPGSEDREEFVDGVEREGDPFESLDGAFEEMDVGAVDPETVWQDLASAESRGSVGDPAQRTYADVSKHSYCEQCEHFSGPPEIACHHEGTEIVEFLDMETVRVVDCPIVAERAELEVERSVASQDEDDR